MNITQDDDNFYLRAEVPGIKPNELSISAVRNRVSLAGKGALVTGGTEGVGEATVSRLVAAGAKVATTARSELPQGQRPALFVRTDPSTVQRRLPLYEATLGYAAAKAALATYSKGLSNEVGRRGFA